MGGATSWPEVMLSSYLLLKHKPHVRTQRWTWDGVGVTMATLKKSQFSDVHNCLCL